MVLRKLDIRYDNNAWEGVRGEELFALNQEAIMTHGLVDGNPYDSAADCVYRSTERTQYPSFEDYMLGDSRPENAFEHPATRYSTAGNEQNSNTGATGVTSAGDAMRGTAMGESVGGAVGGSGVQARVQVQVQVPHRSVVPAHVSSFQHPHGFTSFSSDHYAVALPNEHHSVNALSSQQPYGSVSFSYPPGFSGHAISSQTTPPFFHSTAAPYMMSHNSSDGSLSDESANSSPSAQTPRPSYNVMNTENFSSLNENGAGLQTAHLTDTSRGMPSLNMSTAPPMAAAYGIIGNPSASFYRENSSSTDGKSLTFTTFQTMHDIYSEGQHVMPVIDAQTLRNVFWLDPHWTCYRRNYISVSCSYKLANVVQGKPLFLETGPPEARMREQVQALALKLTAVVDKAQGKEIVLVQYTPKRDKRSSQPVIFHRAYPKARHDMAGLAAVSEAPLLPLQTEEDENSPVGSSAPHQHTTITFDRIQFETATANNGRRRAEQQYYHLVVGLYADIRKSPDSEVKWTKIAHKVSDKIIVRGRSPRHYKKGDNEGSGSSGGPDGGSNGSAGPPRSNGSPPRRPGAQRGVGSASSSSSYSRVGGYNQSATSYQTHHQSHYSHPSTLTSYTETITSPIASHLMRQSSDAVESDSLEQQFYREYRDESGYMYFPGHLGDHIPSTHTPSSQTANTVNLSDQHRRQPNPLSGHVLKSEDSKNTSGHQSRYSENKEAFDTREMYTPRSFPYGSEGFMYNQTMGQASIPWQPDSCGRYQAADTTRGWYPGLTSTGY